jgi:hypothetical protein
MTRLANEDSVAWKTLATICTSTNATTPTVRAVSPVASVKTAMETSSSDRRPQRSARRRTGTLAREASRMSATAIPKAPMPSPRPWARTGAASVSSATS